MFGGFCVEDEQDSNALLSEGRSIYPHASGFGAREYSAGGRERKWQSYTVLVQGDRKLRSGLVCG